MITPEITRFIREEVKKQLNVILAGEAGDNSSIETETINNLYPGSPQISDRPVMHPYGLASRAPAGTISVTAKHGADAHNRMVIGHRDFARKQLSLDEGEVVLYGAEGEVVLTTASVSASKGFRVETKFGFLEFDDVSDLNFDTGTVQAQFGHGGKVVVKNLTGTELVAAIIQLFTDIQEGLVTTMLGPEPLVMPTFALDLAKLQTFQG